MKILFVLLIMAIVWQGMTISQINRNLEKTDSITMPSEFQKLDKGMTEIVIWLLILVFICLFVGFIILQCEPISGVPEWFRRGVC